MQYEWDEDKNVANRRKHDVSFELAVLAFDDENCLMYPERIDDETGEQRWHALGKAQIEAGSGVLLLVVHVYRGYGDGEEIIRIISARAATPGETRRYYAN